MYNNMRAMINNNKTITHIDISRNFSKYILFLLYRLLKTKRGERKKERKMRWIIIRTTNNNNKHFWIDLKFIALSLSQLYFIFDSIKMSIIFISAYFMTVLFPFKWICMLKIFDRRTVWVTACNVKMKKK